LSTLSTSANSTVVPSRISIVVPGLNQRTSSTPIVHVMPPWTGVDRRAACCHSGPARTPA
jgi:hypothetical protein